MRALVLGLVSVALVALPGCQCMQQMEQWKCDNWGMCHFAQPRPGVYAPMVLPPSYGVPPTGLAPTPTINPVYPAASMASTVPPPVTYAPPPAPANPPRYPPAVASPYGGTVVPSGNCRECQK
jgi:hypothetical protein